MVALLIVAGYVGLGLGECRGGLEGLTQEPLLLWTPTSPSTDPTAVPSLLLKTGTTHPLSFSRRKRVYPLPGMYGQNVIGAQMLEVFLSGVGTVLRLERDALSLVK